MYHVSDYYFFFPLKTLLSTITKCCWDPRRWSHLISFLRVCSVRPPYDFLNGIFADVTVAAGEDLSHEEPFRHANGQLGPHGLDAVHDLALVSQQDDSQSRKVGVGEACHGVQRRHAGLLEVVDVTRQLQRCQPLFNRLELEHVRGLWTQRFGMPARLINFNRKENCVLVGRNENTLFKYHDNHYYRATTNLHLC